MAKSVVAFSLEEFDPSYTRVLVGDADFRYYDFTDLGTLEVITGDAKFRNSQVEDLGNLTTIGGNADFRDSKIKNLGNLTIIYGDADFRNSQVKDLGKLKTIKGFVSFDNQELADQWKKRSNKDNFKTGGQSLSKTPAPKKERIYGSEKNKPESSKDTKSAEKIEFNEKTLETIKNKVAEHNEKNPKKKVTLASAKAVVRRGMGAYSSTHRPTISGGKPNSRVAWGLARLNAFFYKIINGKSKSGKYSQDDDLINELGYKVAKYNDGGLIAPNGKPSNLTPEQYKLVRTPAFKEWFGDWENDPENSSKVVDENGEPKVMYHGARGKFTIFSDINDNKLSWTEGGKGFYFTSLYDNAYAYGKNVLSCFIKSNYIISDGKQHAFVSEYDVNKIKSWGSDGIYFDGQILNTEGKWVMVADELVVFNPNQIKLADGTNTTFDSNNPDIRFMAGGRTKKAKTDRSGNPIGDGNFHVDYFVEDMTEYPQVKISVSKSDSTESVYVRYFNEDNAESITLRFSMHENNAVKFGYQLNGYTASKNDILYELGLINRKFVPNTYLSITKRQVKKVDLPKYEESNLSIKEMYDLGEGADISMHKGKIAKGSNYLIQGDTVEKIIADTGRFEYFVNGGVPKKFKFDIEEDEDEDRTEISINGVGKVILTMTYPEYEFMDDIGEDGLEELGIEEGEIIGKIEHIKIEDDFKGKGYAKLLMKKAIEIAEEKGLMPLYLNASPMGNKGLNINDLTAFYESFGFEIFLEQGNNNLMILK